MWRHIFIVGLAITLTVIGFEKQSPPGATASDGEGITTATQQALSNANQAFVNLPTVQSITLPPLPVKKEGLKNPYFAARNIILLDDTSKLPLYEKNPHEPVAIASTTKIATAIVAIENYKLNQMISTSETATSTIGSKVGLRVGEQATTDQLLHGLLMVSGNDAAIVLAEQMAKIGDVNKTDRFVQAMNSIAQKLNLENTQFFDSAGLNDGGHATAHDMAILMSQAMIYPEFATIIKLGNYDYTNSEGDHHSFKNSNRLVNEMYYEGIEGGKTGFTPKTPEGGAGHCLIAAATRNGHRLIAVVLGTDSNEPQASQEVARSLFDYGFNNFTWQTITR